MTAEYFYKDPRLSMSRSGRFLVRLIAYITYGFLLVGGFILWAADTRPTHAIGALLLLFLLARLYKSNKSERPLNRVSLRHPNIALYVHPEAQRLIERALDHAAGVGGNPQVHLLRVLVSNNRIRQSLLRLDLVYADVIALIDKELRGAPALVGSKERQALIERVVISAFPLAKAHDSLSIEAHHLFGALGTSGDGAVQNIFKTLGINAGDLETVFVFARRHRARLHRHHASLKRHRSMNRAWTARPTPMLDEFAVDLTEIARDGYGGLLVGHRQEYERLLNVLSRPGNPSALLIGDPGAGKSALVAHLAYEMVKDRVPKPLFDKRVVEFSLASLAAGADPPTAQARIERVLSEIAAAGNIVLYIPDIHTLMTAESQSERAITTILLPIVASGGIPTIGGTYPREFKRYLETDNNFGKVFEPIVVNELSETEAVQYLVYSSYGVEEQARIMVTHAAIKEAVRIAHGYLRHKLLPSSAEDLLKESVAAALLRNDGVLNAADVIATAERKVNVKLHHATAEESTQLLNLETIIHKRFVDQEEAVSAVARALREYRAGLSRKGGPIATFLFCGPTGVGKTELAKILAELQFGDKQAMVRFDMTEYQEKSSIIRFIGSPDGSVTGSLTEAVRAKPYALVLLDEFEKANPDILNLFLQVFDDGRLTDGLGRVIDFTNTIIIATSNAHSILIQQAVAEGKGVSDISTLLKQKLTDYFKPELINRFSKIVVFKPLSRADILKIAALNVTEIVQTLIDAQGIGLSFNESSIAALAKLGFDPTLGARPLRQAINDNIRSPLADKILRGELRRGQQVNVGHNGTAFTFIASE